MKNLIIGLMLLLLSGCASGYSKFYTQRVDESGINDLETLKVDQTPIIVKTGDLKHEVERYLAKNFAIIGESSFNGGMESDENIISKAITGLKHLRVRRMPQVEVAGVSETA